MQMFYITIEHESSFFFLLNKLQKYYQLLLDILDMSAHSIKNDNANLYKLWCVSAYKKWTPFLIQFCDAVKIMQPFYFEYFENDYQKW